ncbi:MAG: TonB-dependent siderophore receptor [Opitutaceae bacterium]
MNPGTCQLVSAARRAMCAMPVVLACSCLAATSASKPSEDPAIQLEAFNVVGVSGTGYGVSAFSSATRLKTPILDVPQSVSVVTATLLEDIGAIDYAQAVAYVPGVSYRQNVNDGSIIRGFDAFNVYRNGFRMSGYVSDNVSLDRIEIIKGPAAAIAGASESGGLVNRITKKPLGKRHLSVRTIVGSYELLRAEIDVGGPVANPGNNLTYRLVVAGQHGGVWRDWEEQRKLSLNPSLNWRITPSTNLLLEAEHLDALTSSNEGTVYLPCLDDRTTNPIPIRGGATPRVALNPRWAPQSFNTNDRKLEGRDQQVTNFFATLTHAFTPNLSVRQTLMRQSSDIDTPKTRAAHNQYIGTDGGVYVPRTYQLSIVKSDNLAAQGDLVLEYGFLGTRHQTLGGYEYVRGRTDNELSLGALADISVYEPDNDVPLGAAALSTSQTTENRSFSYFVNHQSRLWHDRIVLTGGLRRDTAKGQRLNDRRNSRETVAANPADLDSPMYGATLKPVRWLAIYAVQSEAGAPLQEVRRYPNIPATDPRQQVFTAEPKRTNEEFGVKAELIGGRLTASLAHFDTLSQDAVRGDLDATVPGGTKNVIEAGNRAKGWELEFFGTPLPKLNLIGGYTRIETSTVSGREFRGVPRHKLTTFAAYDLRDRNQTGFRVKGGFTYQTSVVGRSENNFRIPGGRSFDAGVDYSRPRWNFALNVNNLTDEILPIYAISQSSNTVTPPRTVLFSVRRDF